MGAKAASPSRSTPNAWKASAPTPEATDPNSTHCVERCVGRLEGADWSCGAATVDVTIVRRCCGRARGSFGLSCAGVRAGYATRWPGAPVPGAGTGRVTPAHVTAQLGEALLDQEAEPVGHAVVEADLAHPVHPARRRVAEAVQGLYRRPGGQSQPLAGLDEVRPREVVGAPVQIARHRIPPREVRLGAHQVVRRSDRRVPSGRLVSREVLPVQAPLPIR